MEKIILIFQKFVVRDPEGRGGFVQLFVSKRLIQGLATAMMGMFIPVFIYETTGGQFWVVSLFFAVISAGYALFLVPGMKITNMLGFSKTLALGATCSIGTYALLYMANASNILLLLIPLSFTMVCFRIFHWVPYHVDFTAFTKGERRGRDVSIMFATIAFMGMVGPILAGYVIANSGYNVLFLIGMILLTCAAISYLFVPAVEEKFTWTYAQTIRNMFKKDFKNVLAGQMASGAEVAVALVAWPIFLYEIVDGNVLEIGALSAVIVGATIVIQLFFGKYLDRRKDSKVLMLRRGSILYALGWIIKIFVLSVTQIFFIGLYHNVVKIFLQTPYNTILYDMSGEQGQYIDEFTVMSEIATHVGRTLTLLIMIGLTFYFSIEWTFIIAALASLLVNMIYKTSVPHG